MTTNTQKRDMTIEEFCDLHEACEVGREWALENCDSMQDAWQKLEPEWLLWVATQEGVLTDKELRLFACWCARQVWHLIEDDRSKRAVEVAERFANGEATEEELEAAESAAESAARSAAWSAAAAAAYSAARSARSAAWSAVTPTAALVASLTCVRTACRVFGGWPHG